MLFCQFTATGLMIIARNYLDVYPYENWTAKVCIYILKLDTSPVSRRLSPYLPFLRYECLPLFLDVTRIHDIS